MDMTNSPPVTVPVKEKDEISPNMAGKTGRTEAAPILTLTGPSAILFPTIQPIMTAPGPSTAPASSIEVDNIRKHRTEASRLIAILIKTSREAKRRQREAEMDLSDFQKRVQRDTGPIAVQNVCCLN